MIAQKNQQNPPLPKKKRVDSQGNSKKRIFCKSGTATLLLASGLTENASKILLNSLQENTKKLGGKVECTFFLAR